MKVKTGAALLLLLAGCAGTGHSSKGYDAALARYNQARRVPSYEAFANQFWKMNDAAHFDQKTGCYDKEGGTLNLVLILDRTDPKGGAGKPLHMFIKETYTDVDTPRAKCFRKAYLGLASNIPPFLPFPLQATFK